MTEAERTERAAEAVTGIHVDVNWWHQPDPSSQTDLRSHFTLTKESAQTVLTAAITAYLGGDVVVPREPTQVMIDVARKNGFEGDDDHVRSDYRAMISAAEMEG